MGELQGNDGGFGGMQREARRPWVGGEKDSGLQGRKRDWWTKKSDGLCLASSGALGRPILSIFTQGLRALRSVPGLGSGGLLDR